jgi:hypothetical protein
MTTYIHLVLTIIRGALPPSSCVFIVKCLLKHGDAFTSLYSLILFCSSFIVCALFRAVLFILSSVHFVVIPFLPSVLLHVASVSLCLADNGDVSVGA